MAEKKSEKSTTQTSLLDRVDDGFNYFNGYRLEELKTDDAYYIKAFMDYIESLECKVDRLAKELRNGNNWTSVLPLKK